MSKIVVKKFGGTSVGDLSRIRHVAELCDRYLRSNAGRLVIVASAMAGETNRLLALAKSCVAEPSRRELDALVATGEQQSCALLAMALCERGYDARSFTAAQVGISTDSQFTSAQIEAISSDRLKPLLEQGVIPVITGFQGINSEGDITTLGRGGGDITAVAVAAALKADACYIYTDVDGIYSADPRICRKARRLDRVSHEEMLQLAASGAKVLHPRAVEFAYRYRVPLVTLSTFQPGNGTWVVSEEELMEKPVVSGVTSRADEARVSVLNIPRAGAALATLFEALARKGISVDMITQAASNDESTTISFTVADDQSVQALEAVRALVPELNAKGAFLDRDIARVSIVGVGMRSGLGVAAQMLRILSNNDIEVSMLCTSDISISAVVPRKYSDLAVRLLHQNFIEGAHAVPVHTAVAA